MKTYTVDWKYEKYELLVGPLLQTFRSKLYNPHHISINTFFRLGTIGTPLTSAIVFTHLADCV